MEPEPEPKLRNFLGSGSGSSQKGRLRAAPAPKHWFIQCSCNDIVLSSCVPVQEFAHVVVSLVEGEEAWAILGGGDKPDPDQTISDIYNNQRTSKQGENV